MGAAKFFSRIYQAIRIEVNEELEDGPERINHDPYGDGWMYKMTIEDAEELENLLDAAAYTDSIIDDE